MEKCDIIIVSYNAFLFTQKCIDSIKKNTDFSYRIIVVDNGSKGDTIQYLKTLEDVKVIYNNKNYGFGYANNIGLKHSDAKYVCFLNSDTIVTKGWLGRLVKIASIDNIGMVGPMTNFVSSECQQIDFEYSTNEKLEEFAKDRFYKFGYERIKTNRLVGFCLLCKREVLDVTGGFDERYMQGNFEDDDLCLRIIERGYELYCSKGVFIHHFCGQSFKHNFGNITDNTILERNKKLYLSKWYDSKRILEIFVKKSPLNITYVLASNSPSGGVKVVFEHANRLKNRGHNVSIYCGNNENNTWFETNVQVIFGDLNEIPENDIIIATYFTTIPYVVKAKAKLKIHLCQGYEGHLHKEEASLKVIQNNYSMLKNKIVVSKWLKEIIDKEYDIDSQYVPNGIDPYIFSFKPKTINSVPRVLIVGYLNLKIKGVSTAIDVIKSFTGKIRLVRMSSHDKEDNFICEFHKMSEMSQEEIAKVYESCDISINMHQKVEGFSLPQLEAMACGLAVITTDCGGSSEYTKFNENCIIIQNDIKHCQHALSLLINNKDLYEKISKNAVETAKKFYWYEKIDILEKYYYEMFEKSRCNSEISLCMIVKNESEFLNDCLDSVKDLVSEMVIVDTGSTDDTIKIAKSFGAKIFHYNWNDDFSAARNFALEKCTQSWVLVLDADEIISKKDIIKIKMLLKKEDVAYSFITRNYVCSKNIEDVKICTGENIEEEKDFIGWCKSEKTRLFPNKKEIKFEGKVHELVEDSVEKLNLLIEDSKVCIHHYGHTKKDEEKNRTYLELGKQKLIDNGDIKSLYELALQYMSLNNNDEALVIWRRLLEREPRNHEFLSHIGTTFNLLNDYRQAEKYFLQSLSISESEYAFKHIAICYAKQNRYQEAYDSFKKIVYNTNELKIMADFACCCNTLQKYDESILILEKCMRLNKRETISWGLLEVAYNAKGAELAKRNRLPQALNMFRNALQINSNFDAARSNLNQVEKMLHPR